MMKIHKHWDTETKVYYNEVKYSFIKQEGDILIYSACIKGVQFTFNVDMRIWGDLSVEEVRERLES